MTTYSLDQPSRPRHPIAGALGRVLLRSTPYAAVIVIEGVTFLSGRGRTLYIAGGIAVTLVLVAAISYAAWLYQRHVYGDTDAKIAAMRRAIPYPDPEEQARRIEAVWRKVQEDDVRPRY